ncbi:MAG: hypothetical protein NTZ24_11295 [Deltaproteobacteria bacterium]|nr:hypothetical protein [Deltaproteobacteria bacterium]
MSSKLLHKNYVFSFLIILFFITLTTGAYEQANDFKHFYLTGYSSQDIEIDSSEKLTGIALGAHPYVLDSVSPDIYQFASFHYFIEKTFIQNLSLMLPCIYRGPPKTA